MTNISTLRPGLLVSLKTSLTGNVSYAVTQIEADHYAGDGTRRAAWETARVIENPVEHEEGIKVRSKARSLVTAVCSPSSFGLLCPESRRDDLSAAIEEAHQLVDRFNRRAAITRVSVFAIVGRVASDDIEAVRAINSEIRDLMDSMERGLVKLDVAAVRDAANRAKNLSAMLSPEASERAEKAIQAARSAARRIVKAGELAAGEIDQATLATIQRSRAAFLDMEEAREVLEPGVEGRAVDLMPAWDDAPAVPSSPVLDWSEPVTPTVPAVRTPAIELGD